MVALYNRALQFYVGADGSGLDLSALHCVFTIHHTTVGTPGWLEARVYNLSDATVKLIGTEFTDIAISAGYSNDTGTLFGQIFRGTIMSTTTGHDSATDSYIEIIANDGDLSNWATLNGTLAKGHTQQDVQHAINATLAANGITAGYSGPLASTRMPRGRALYGNVRDVLHDFVRTNYMTASIHAGQINYVPIGGTLPGEAVVLNSSSGLVGWPRQTPEGVTFRSLLNPAIKHNCQIRINNAAVVAATAQGGSYDPYTGLAATPSIAADGYYRVLAVDHVCDTRGQAWYTDGWCVAVTGAVTANAATASMDVDATYLPQQGQAAPAILQAPTP